jgi:hypothetical protein
LGDCSCVAFTSENEMLQSGCVTWHGDMNDTRTYTQVGQDLYVRVDKNELGMYSFFLLGKILKSNAFKIVKCFETCIFAVNLDRLDLLIHLYTDMSYV